MNVIRDQRAIVDRRALAGRLAAIAEARRPPAEERAAVLAELKAALAAGCADIGRRFAADGDGRQATRELGFLIDQLLRTLHDFTTTHPYPLANPSAGERLALVAVGGYGRGELAPQSDVDILFLLPYKLTPHGEQVVEYVLYHLWDLGLKVGHATRSIDECIRQARADLTIRTNLLEARYVCGEQALYQELRRRYAKEIVAGTGRAFVQAKLAERDERHRRMGNSRYALEPNVKEGKGGLRDLHALFWIAKYLYAVDDMATLVDRGVFSAAEAATFEKAESFLWSVRFCLHDIAGRPEERLSFELQPEIAARLGYTDHAGTRGVERLMKHYFLTAKNVGDLTRIFCAALEAENRKPAFRLSDFRIFRQEIEGFRVDRGRLAFRDAKQLTDNPVDMLRIFEVAQRHDLDVHPSTLRLITQNLRLVDRELRADPEANRLFLEMLTSRKDPEGGLRRLSEAGVFGRFIPDFGRVVAQMQYDMYHHYTVDEHTLFAIGILARIEKGELAEESPVSSRVVHQVLSRRVLYLAVMLHDIAKGRGGDHSELGEEVAQKLCPRLGLSDEETETVAWLVRHHLAMSKTAFQRDIDDPQTIADFAGLVQSLERLRLLLVLTVADIRAVGPKVWNGWKAQLLRDLYHRAEEHLSGGLVAEGREARAAAATRALRQELADWSDDDVATHVVRGMPAYWLSFDTASLARHARLVRTAEARAQDLSLETLVDRWRAVTEVTIYTPDRHGLFSLLAGAIAAAGGNIVDARIFTLGNGMALDTFWVQDAEGGPFERPDRLARLSATVEQTLGGRALPDLDRRLSGYASRFDVFPVVPRVLIDNNASATHTVIEVNGRDRPGLLYRVTAALTELKLQISSAKISTFGQRAVDVFYVKDLYGLKVEADPRLKAIRTRLLEALEPAPVPAATPDAATAASAAQ